jgi:hypothetical protein
MVLRRPFCPQCYYSKDDQFIDRFLCKRPCNHSCHDGHVPLGEQLMRERAAAA